MEHASLFVEAADKAVAMVEEYSEYDPYDTEDPSNPWKNPEEMFARLDGARKDVMTALEKRGKDTRTPADDQLDHNDNDDEDTMRAMYLDMITDAFADVLDNLRKEEGGAMDLNVLVDCLQSGMDLLTADEKELLMLQDNESLSDDDSGLTPHERRRLELGFQLEVTSN